MNKELNINMRTRHMHKNSRRELITEADSSDGPRAEWLKGTCTPGLCGTEAACTQRDDNTYACVCPHDLSPPTPVEKLCPNRKTVPLTRKSIIPIGVLPSNGANLTTLDNTTTTTTVRQNLDGKILSAITTKTAPSGVFAALFGVAMLFILIPAVICFIKRKSISKCFTKDGHQRKHNASPSPLSLSKGLLGSYVPNPQYSVGIIPELPAAISVPELNREKLFFVKEIGEGCFGKVYKGELHFEDGNVDTVAIKVLKETATKAAEEDFMREVEIMSAFRHKNILSLIGIVLKESAGRPWMVFEYIPHGDLANVLRSNSRQFWKPIPGLDPLDKESLLQIAMQIAAGMNYLAEQRFVHNDLACRNCLVGVNLTVKIADFGMSRDVYTCDYYRIGGSRPVPLRWMSPESVMYRRFTLESDVWSYGVVLWEIYSLGKQPYYGLNNEEVVKLILQGIMLIPPDGCPPFTCDLMRSCWKTEPRDRIKFHEICTRLNKAWEDMLERKMAEEEQDKMAVILPRPPVFPVSNIHEVLDCDDYLTPQTNTIKDYLEPLPD